MSDFTPGMRLHDRYQLEEPVGSGGMAQVWRATDLVLGRAVAVKTLDGKLAQDQQLRAGAQREAQAAAKLTHPNITAVHDYGEITFGDGRIVPFLVMELLSGQTLAQRLRKGPLPWAQAAVIAGQIAGALAAAHAQGVVHQDIKPANIMLTSTGAKILDFGIAAIRGRPGSPDWISGTPAYASPERLAQAAPHPSADVFSLGVLMYEMAAGRLPWPIQTWEQAAALERTPPAPLPKSVPGKEILAALALDPARRPSAAQLAHQLGEAPGGPTSLLPAAPASHPSPTLVAKPGFAAGSARVPEHPTRTYELPVAAPRPRRSPHLTAGVTLIVLLIALGIVFLFAAMLQNPGGNGVQANTPTKGPVVAPTAANPAPTTPSPATITESITLIRNTINAAILAGDISEKRADGLRDRVRDITERAERNKPKDIVEKLEDLQEDVRELAEDGEIAAPVATALDAMIAQAISRVDR